MKTSAQYRLIHDRKKQGGEQLVQVEVTFVDGTRKFVSTEVHVTPLQWKNNQVVNHRFAARLNLKITGLIDKLRAEEIRSTEREEPFTKESIDIALGKSQRMSLIEFMDTERDKMTLSDGTMYLHKRVARNLEECNIKYFQDLTYNNIDNFDRFIKKFLGCQTSVSKQHSVVKAYIHLAQSKGIIPFGESPYNRFIVPKGKSKIRTRLSDDEIDQMAKAELDGEIGVSRDIYMFMIYTGVGHKDLCSLTPDNLVKNGNEWWIEGLRKKTDEQYTVYLLPQAIELIKKYSGETTLFPFINAKKQNENIRVAAALAGIKKHLTNYTGRHTCASWLLRKRVPIEVIRDILGHTQIETTLIYAKLEAADIRDSLNRAFSLTT
jgi:integrase